MKNLIKSKLAVLSVMLLGLSLSFSAFSEDDMDREAKRVEMRAKFDVDGDGKLNDAERQAAREAHKQRKLERMDTNGDGEISDTEKAAAKEKHREKMVKRFDKDGDGKLNDSEREAAKAARAKFKERHHKNKES